MKSRMLIFALIVSVLAACAPAANSSSSQNGIEIEQARIVVAGQRHGNISRGNERQHHIHAGNEYEQFLHPDGGNGYGHIFSCRIFGH